MMHFGKSFFFIHYKLYLHFEGLCVLRLDHVVVLKDCHRIQRHFDVLRSPEKAESDSDGLHSRVS